MENSKFDSICSCICGNAKQFQFHFQSNSVPRAIDFHSFFFEVAHIFVFISYHNPPIRCMSSFQRWLKIQFNSASFSLLWRSRLTMMRPHDSNLMTTSLPFAHRFGETIHCSWTLRDDGRGLITSYLPEKTSRVRCCCAYMSWVRHHRAPKKRRMSDPFLWWLLSSFSLPLSRKSPKILFTFPFEIFCMEQRKWM